MKVHRDGKKVDFSEVMADWIVQHAGFGRSSYESFVQADAATVLAIMRAMVANRHLYEMLIKFAVRYRNSMDKVSVQDVQDADQPSHGQKHSGELTWQTKSGTRRSWVGNARCRCTSSPTKPWPRSR